MDEPGILLLITSCHLENPGPGRAAEIELTWWWRWEGKTPQQREFTYYSWVTGIQLTEQRLKQGTCTCGLYTLFQRGYKESRLRTHPVSLKIRKGVAWGTITKTCSLDTGRRQTCTGSKMLLPWGLEEKRPRGVTANRLAQLVEHQTTVWEVEGSSPSQTNIQGL